MLIENLHDQLKSAFLDLFNKCYVASEYMEQSDHIYPSLIRVSEKEFSNNVMRFNSRTGKRILTKKENRPSSKFGVTPSRRSQRR